MKINADILYDNLKLVLDVTRYGEGTKELTLGYVELFIPVQTTFKSHHLYLCKAEDLPKKPNLEQNTVIICVGEQLLRTYLWGKCICLEIVKEQFQHVFNEIQAIFTRYQEWYLQLCEVLLQSGSLQEVMDIGCEILGNPLSLKDGQFNIWGYSSVIDTDDSLEKLWKRRDADGKVDESVLSQFIQTDNLNLVSTCYKWRRCCLCQSEI